MSYAKDELTYTECDVCGHHTECFLQYEYDATYATCPQCLRTSDRTIDCE